MKLGVIAAMDLELQKLLEYFPPQRKIQLAKNTFYIYEQKTSQVIMVCAGQGKTNAISCTIKEIKECWPNFNI